MIDLDEIGFLGHGLDRPECVLANRQGRLFTADWRGGVAVIEPDGRQWLLKARDPGFDLRPNGICLMPDDSFLLAHLGNEDGGVFQLMADGDLRPFCLEADGMALPPTNYPHRDDQGRVWITVSTRKMPRALGYRPDVADGFIILVDKGRARIVADNLGYTNECLLHPDGKRLFVNETFARRLSSYDIADDGSLSNKCTIAEFGPGSFPDGLTFDAEGGIWITSIISNRVIRITEAGGNEILLQDCDDAHLDAVEQAFQGGCLGRPHLDRAVSRRLANISSLAFGGVELKTIYLGCLLGDSIAHFQSPVAGHPPSHWEITGPAQPMGEAA